MTPQDRLLSRVLATSGIDSSRWETIRAGLRDRAFFSSRIESARLLHEARQRVASMLGAQTRPDGAIETRASAVSAIIARARLEGAATGRGGPADPGSPQRAALISDTNAGLAAGYIRRAASTSPGAILAFPAQELIRVRPSRHPRGDWAQRFTAAGGQILQGRMAAPVSDPCWARLSRFGEPYPPFDYGSGMGLRAIPRQECQSLGLPLPSPLQAASLSSSATRGFNDSLSAGLSLTDPSDPSLSCLKAAFGDQVIYKKDPSGSITAQWRADLIRDAFASPPSPGAIIRLGRATQDTLSKASPRGQAIIGTRGLTLTGDFIRHVRSLPRRPRDPDPRDTPILPQDLDLIPTLWRDPDAILPGAGPHSIILAIDTLDGGQLRMPVTKHGDTLTPDTLLKKHT